MSNLLQDPTILRSRNKSSGHMGIEFYEPHCRSERHGEQKSLDTAGIEPRLHGRPDRNLSPMQTEQSQLFISYDE
jgi:hypothetical protein